MAEDYGLWRYNTTPEAFKQQMPEYLRNRGIDPKFEAVFDLNDDDTYNCTRVNFTDGKSYAFKEWPPAHVEFCVSSNYNDTTITHKNYIDSVIFAEGVTELRENEFGFATSLRFLHLPNTLKKINDYAFRHKTHDYGGTSTTCLEELIIPDSVTYLGGNLFRMGNELTGPKKVVIGSGVTEIGESAFSGCTRLEICEFKEGISITEIPNGMFYRCENLGELKIPESVTTIGESAFSRCNIEELILPEGITTIPERCFGDSNIHNLVIPSSVKEIKDYAFVDFSGTTSLSFPNVTEIKEGAFWGAKLKSLSFGSKLTKVYDIFGDNRGGNDQNLEELVFESVSVPTSSKVPRVSSECKIYVPDGSVDAYKSSWVDLAEHIYPLSQKGSEPPVLEPIGDKAILTLDNGEVVHVLAYSTMSTLNAEEVPSNTVSIEVTNNTVKIGRSVCRMSDTLTSVTLSNSVKIIGENAFMECKNLTWEHITFGDSLWSIEKYAFAFCPKFRDITLPSSVTSIGSLAFNGCSSLKYVTFGDNVSRIGYLAFSNCTSLMSVKLKSVVYLDSEYIFDDSNDCTIFVFNKYKDFYQTNREWRKLSSRIKYII